MFLIRRYPGLIRSSLLPCPKKTTPHLGGFLGYKCHQDNSLTWLMHYLSPSLNDPAMFIKSPAMTPKQLSENEETVTGTMLLLPLTQLPYEKMRVVRGSLLSYREMQTLLCISEGFTSAEIARQLGLRPATIDTYRKSIIRKLNVKNLAQAITYSFRNNIIQ